MSIEVNMTDQDKKQITALVTESQVLTNLLGERRAILEHKAKEILEANALSPSLYVLKFNLSLDKWEAVLKQGAIILPNQEVKQKIKLN